MRINYVKFENFALIESGMGLKVLELDFDKAPYRINLILGNNGTGKTAILSNLHPFAYLGNLENRDDCDLIIPGENGLKYMELKDKNNNYVIEHRYIWNGYNKPRTVMSYIMKNRYELNPNGGVNNFKKIIETEFDIDMYYLRLIRLGTNVNNFIEMKSAERKVFIGKILEDIEPYTFDNKIISNRAAELKMGIKIATDKKNKLGVENLELIETQLEEKKANRDKIQKELEELFKEVYQYNYSVDKDKFDEYNESALVTVNRSIDELKDKIKKLVKPKRIYINTLEDKYKNVINDRNNEINTYNQLKVEKIKRLAELEIRIKKYTEELDDIENKKKNYLTDIELKSMYEYVEKVKAKLKAIDTEYNFSDSSNHPSINTDEVLGDVNNIKSCILNVKECIDFRKTSRMLFKSFMDKNNNDLYTVSLLVKKEYEDKYSDLCKIKENKIRVKRVICIPYECNIFFECPFYKHYYDTTEEKMYYTKQDIEDYLHNLEEVKEIINLVYNTFKIMAIRDKDKFSKYYQLTEEGLYSAIYNENIKLFIDLDVISKLLTMLEYYKDYCNYTDNLRKTEDEIQLKKYKNNYVLDKDVDYKIEAYKKTIKCLTDEKNEIDITITKIDDAITHVKDIIKDYTDMMSYNYFKRDLEDKLSISEKKKEEIEKTIAQQKEFGSVMKKFVKREAELKAERDKLDNEIQDLIYKKTEFKKLTDDTKELEVQYDVVKHIKDATSSTNGIPLIYVQRYCSKLCTVANTIIKKIYNGDLQILDFEITEDSFKIPYKIKNTIVKDIKNASQAESCVMKVAISFAILASYMTKYNIVLLDEIDGPMNKENKEKFMSNLEDILDIIHSEQAFIITQSRMFNSFPVNLITTDTNYYNLGENSYIIFNR